MAINEQQKTSLLGVTSFMFNYAPDQASYARFETLIDNNPSFYDLGTALGKTDAFTSQFDGIDTFEGKVDLILGRLGLEEGTLGYDRGVEFITTRIQEDGVPEGQVMMEIGEKLLQDTPPEGLEDAAAILRNKIAVSDTYLESGIEGYSSETLPELLAGITADQASVDAANEAIAEKAEEEDPGVPGETISLTADVDDFVGTANDDTFTADLTVAGSQTLNAYDRIDGGEGVDTLKATLLAPAGNGDFTDGGGSPLAQAVQNVENLYFRSLDTNVAVDMTGYAGAEQIWANRGQANLTIENLNNAVTLGVVEGDTTNRAFNVNYTDGAVESAVDGQGRFTQDLVLDNASNTTLEVSNTGGTFGTANVNTATLNVDATGDNTLVVGDAGAQSLSDKLDTVNVTGEGAIDLSLTNGSIDNDGLSVTTGAGDDTVRVNGNGLEDAEIDLGAGNNTLNVAGTQAAIDYGNFLNGVENVQNLVFAEDQVLDGAIGGAATTELDVGSIDSVGFAGGLNASNVPASTATLDLATRDELLTALDDANGVSYDASGDAITFTKNGTGTNATFAREEQGLDANEANTILGGFAPGAGQRQVAVINGIDVVIRPSGAIYDQDDAAQLNLGFTAATLGGLTDYARYAASESVDVTVNGRTVQLNGNSSSFGAAVDTQTGVSYGDTLNELSNEATGITFADSTGFGAGVTGDVIFNQTAGTVLDSAASAEDVYASLDGSTFQTVTAGDPAPTEQFGGGQGQAELQLDSEASELTVSFGDLENADTADNAGNSDNVELAVSEDVSDLTLQNVRSNVDLTVTNQADANGDTESLQSLTLADASEVDTAGEIAPSSYSVELEDVNGLSTINLSGVSGVDNNGNDVATGFTVDAGNANFDGAVSVNVSNVGDGSYNNAQQDVSETFAFSGDIVENATFTINGFNVTNGTNGDKLDFSAFGIDDASDVTIVDAEVGGVTQYTITSEESDGAIQVNTVGTPEPSFFEANAFA